MSFYPERINEHFLKPRNVGQVEDAEAEGSAGSFLCGATLRLTLRIDEQRIAYAKFKATGCGFLIASASVLTETIKDLALSRAATLPESAITDWFDEFPTDRHHCARLCFDALNAALANYHNTAREEWTGDEALICTCFGVSEKTIERAIEEKLLHTINDVTRACNAGGGCGSCHPLIVDILEDYWRMFEAESISAETLE